MLEINLKQLEAFVTTAEFSSFTKAAEALYLTQSTVSAHINAMEQVMGVRLIQRGSRRRVQLTIEGNGHVKIAVCGAIVKEKTAPQLLGEDHVVLKTLGIQPWERETSFLIDGNSNAKSLTIGECYVTPGNWAGFPPHKHDEDNMPAECIAEEIYYFLFDPKEGFGVQCVYTADGSVDEAYRVKNDELVEFPYGYHTTVSTPAYSTYFLWLMAGEHQGFNRSMDPEHAWVAELEKKA